MPIEESHMVQVSAEPVVSYTVKEVLDRIEGKFDAYIDRTLNRLDDMDKRLSAFEHEKANRRVFRENWLALIALGAAILAGIAPFLVSLHG